LKSGYRSNSKEGICPVGVPSGVFAFAEISRATTSILQLAGYIEARMFIGGKPDVTCPIKQRNLTDGTLAGI
jgi:hypothetical protein